VPDYPSKHITGDSLPAPIITVRKPFATPSVSRLARNRSGAGLRAPDAIGHSAPKPAIRGTEIERQGSSQLGQSGRLARQYS
jgi:hypothetical protein